MIYQNLTATLTPSRSPRGCQKRTQRGLRILPILPRWKPGRRQPMRRMRKLASTSTPCSVLTKRRTRRRRSPRNVSAPKESSKLSRALLSRALSKLLLRLLNVNRNPSLRLPLCLVTCATSWPIGFVRTPKLNGPL